MQALVRVPTRDEREPLPRPAADALQVPVIDHPSPNRTGAAAGARAVRPGDRVRVAYRTDRHGLGRSSPGGVRRAAGTDADLVVPVYADRPHDPACSLARGRAEGVAGVLIESLIVARRLVRCHGRRAAEGRAAGYNLRGVRL